MGKLFGRTTNPNEKLFTVEQQEGSEILMGDEGVASIGDATLKHIAEMNSLEREAYRTFVKMGNGNLFEIVENENWEDLNGGDMAAYDEKTIEGAKSTRQTRIDQITKILDEMQLNAEAAVRAAVQSKKDVSEAEFQQAIRLRGRLVREREVLLEELELLEAKQVDDVMGHRDAIVPYEQWQTLPQQSKHWDIPATPKPRARYVGNTRQMFYDHFPEGHPLQGPINSVLFILDKYPLHRILTDTQVNEYNSEHKDNKLFATDISYVLSDGKHDYLSVEAFKSLIYMMVKRTKAPATMKQTVYNVLIQLVTNVATGVSEERPIIREVPSPTDREATITQKGKTVVNLSSEEMVIRALCTIEQEYTDMYRKSLKAKTSQEDPISVYLITTSRRFKERARRGEKNLLNEIKALGKHLYENGFITHKKIVLENGKVEKKIIVDKMRPGHWAIYNDCKYHVSRLTCDHSDPAKTPADFFNPRKCTHSRVEQEQGTRAHKTQNIELKNLLDKMEETYEKALENKDFRTFTSIPALLIQKQHSGALKLTSKEWAKVWSCYNERKAVLSSKLSNSR